jgi:phosphoglycolate phosphatase
VPEPLVLWDVDYTLVNARGLGTRLYQDVFLEMFGCPLAAVAPKAGRTDRAITLDTLAAAGIAEPGAQVDSFLAELARHVTALGGPAPSQVKARAEVRVEALPGAASALAAIAAAGLPQSVLTGNIRSLAELKLRAAGLDTHLDFACGAYGDVHEVRAELVDVARRAAKAAYGRDFGGESTVLVGDTPLDVEAALATGARVVAVATGSYPAGALTEAGAHVVLAGLTDTDRILTAVMAA